MQAEWAGVFIGDQSIELLWMRPDSIEEQRPVMDNVSFHVNEVHLIPWRNGDEREAIACFLFLVQSQVKAGGERRRHHRRIGFTAAGLPPAIGLQKGIGEESGTGQAIK